MSVYIPLTSDKPAPATSKPEDDVTRFARLALVIGALLTLAITAGVLAGVLWGWVDTVRTFFGWWMSLVAVAWTLAAGFGAWWTYALKIKRPVRLEDEDRETRKPKVEVVYQTLDFPAVENFKYAGYKILAGYFFEYPTLTREQAETERLCSQTEWNVFNTIAKHHQIRTPDNLWNKAKDEEALYLWHVTSFEMPEREPGTLVAHLAGGTTLKFDLTKKGILKK